MSFEESKRTRKVDKIEVETVDIELDPQEISYASDIYDTDLKGKELGDVIDVDDTPLGEDTTKTVSDIEAYIKTLDKHQA